MSVHIEKLSGIAFLAFPETLEFLKSELRERFGLAEDYKFTCYGDILYVKDWPDCIGVNLSSVGFSNENESQLIQELPYWARTTLLNPFLLHFESIGDAARALKELQRNWAPYQYQSFRRAALIQEKLPYINLKAKNFPVIIPKSPIGVYTLIDDKTILASAETSSFLPAGRIEFIEDHENPPSRAYLKIQESLTLANLLFDTELPGPDSRCFEAGACPGGWTWVLVNLGSKVYAVDRAELAPELMQNPLVTFQAHDAFTLKPEDIGECDWVFSDVICYPERLLEWVKKWLDSGLTKKMICTIKMQGAIDYGVVRQFAEIPDSRVVHLNYNKHELTWIHVGK
ncbi:SAM-dependent methyltransferase [Treponema sp.]|uniref:SAM-dependent methyltransferase n=1 Tax=Treponema sp. TaxID=166 RepID=UPI00298DFEFB|nr:SAM-dependent methyltransferase [Treponema sp.]MCR5613971.1 SAM-dependent methyltransferase [Treponema sp.]